ncbi:MAG: response regulator [Alphaproteobacteria bacterium]
MRKLLVVDDDPAFVTFIETIAAELGYETRSIADGSGVEDAFHEFDPDVILVDVVLTGLEGIEVGKVLSELNERAKIVLISGHNISFINAGLAVASASEMENVSTSEKPCSIAWLREVLG